MSTTTTPPDQTGNIKQTYKDQLAAQQTKTNAAYDQNVAGYNKQLADAPEQYQSMRNQAYTENAMAEQSRKENMANMGLSGAGGTSQTLQQRNQPSLLSAVGDANRQQQDFTDNINLALGNLGTQHKAENLALVQQNQADLNAALTAYDQWKNGYQLDVEKFETEKKNSEFDRLWTLYKNKNIGIGQLEDLLDMKLKGRR
jgi:hypothetical protein